MLSNKRARPAESRPPPPTKQPRASQQHHRQRALHGADDGGRRTSPPLSRPPPSHHADRPKRPRQPLPSSRPYTPGDAPLSAIYEEQCGTFFQLWFVKLEEDGLSEAEIAKITSKAFRDLQTTARGAADDDDAARPSQPGSLQLTQLFQRPSPRHKPPATNRRTTTDDDSDDNDDDDDDSNDNASPSSVHIQIGPDPPPERPVNLFQALRKKIRTDQGKTAAPLHDDALQRLRAASRLLERPLPDAVSAYDLHTVGAVLLGDVFGGRGQKRLADALLELYGAKVDRALGRSLQSLADDATPPTAGDASRPGLTKLAAFASRLGRVVSYDAPQRTEAEDIHMLHAKVELIREWDRWSQPGRSDRDVAAFLDGEGIARGKGVVLASRVIKYLAKTIDTQPSTLAKKIYAWRPLAILEEALGPGVLALVSKSVGTSYTRLRNEDNAVTTKETRFRAVVAALVNELPLLLDICRACDTYVVQTVLARPAQATPTQALADRSVPGIKMAAGGEKRLLQRTPICDLLAVTATPYPPRGTVQDLAAGDSSDDGGGRSDNDGGKDEDGEGGDSEDGEDGAGGDNEDW